MRVLLVPLGAGLLALAGALLSPPAWAETVRLSTGATLEAHRVTLVGETFVVELALGGGQGTLRLPLERVEPGDRVRLLAARTSDGDARGQLRIARAALEAGLLAQAAERAGRAAELDAALEPEGRALFDRVRARACDEVLAEVELDLRLKHPLAARERALRLLLEQVPVEAPSLHAARARLLLALAEHALAAAAPPPAPAPAPAAPPAAPAAPAPPAALADVLRLQAQADTARERAGDPGVPPAQREVLLLQAADALLSARRVLQTLSVALVPDLAARLEALRARLTATWLDLADLARGSGAWGAALDRVQAALVLEPESERAWELRGWIERDLTAARLPLAGPPLVFEGVWGSPWHAPWGRAYGPGCGCGGGSVGKVAFGHRSGGGGHHVAGTRR